MDTNEHEFEIPAAGLSVLIRAHSWLKSLRFGKQAEKH
jgi:hypothetical protein